MKPSVIAALVASVVALWVAMRKRDYSPKLQLNDTDMRYDIEEFIGNEDL